MARVLYLVHRIPYPPNKGDKVRSYHLLRHLASRHEVVLGGFIDDAEDEQYAAVLRQWCVDTKLIRLSSRIHRFKSLSALVRGLPLTLAYYESRELQTWVDQQRADFAVIFSSSMAQYVDGFGGPVLVDFVDLDSAKWTDYAPQHRWPLSWLYAREGKRLLAYERDVAAKVRQSFFVTDKEAALFKSRAPGLDGRVQVIGNGVDTLYFSPERHFDNPFAAGEIALVFTGAMDYWPNVDAVRWFAESMLPLLRAHQPRIRFHVVGRSPAAAVQSLASEFVNVTGTVADVRPWLQHAALVVAPLRLARGVQNKVLEAMAMSKAVVASADCVGAIDATDGVHLCGASDAAGFVGAIKRLLSQPERANAMGLAARQRVLESYGWDARLAALDTHLAPT